jgi:hypothetical protein
MGRHRRISAPASLSYRSEKYVDGAWKTHNVMIEGTSLDDAILACEMFLNVTNDHKFFRLVCIDNGSILAGWYDNDRKF